MLLRQEPEEEPVTTFEFDEPPPTTEAPITTQDEADSGSDENCDPQAIVDCWVSEGFMDLEFCICYYDFQPCIPSKKALDDCDAQEGIFNGDSCECQLPQRPGLDEAIENARKNYNLIGAFTMLETFNSVYNFVYLRNEYNTGMYNELTMDTPSMIIRIQIAVIAYWFTYFVLW